MATTKVAQGAGTNHTDVGERNEQIYVGSHSKVLRVKVSGPPEGIPVLFFHGIGANIHCFKGLIEAAKLDKKNKVILFDIEGHGRSPLSETGHQGLSIKGFVEDAKDLLNIRSIEQTHIVGHSMGGLIAATFASTYPETVKNLVLIAPAFPAWEASRERVRNRGALARSAGMSLIAEQLGKISLFPRVLSRNPLAKAFVEQAIESCSEVTYALACEAIAEAPLPDWSKIIGEKTLILAGREDALIPKHSIDFVERNIPGTRVIWQEDIGHWSIVEDIYGTGQILADFLE